MSKDSFKVVEFFGTKYRVNLNNEGQPVSLRIMRENGVWDKMSMEEIQQYCGYVYQQSIKDGIENPFMQDGAPKKPYIEMGTTSRGFAIGKFTDHYGQLCSIQESSLATEAAIWIGVDNTGPELKGPKGLTNEDVGSRMHLTQSQAAELLPILTQFVLTGGLR